MSSSIDEAVADLRMRALAARRQIETVRLVQTATQDKLLAMERTAAEVVANWEVLAAIDACLPVPPIATDPSLATPCRPTDPQKEPSPEPSRPMEEISSTHPLAPSEDQIKLQEAIDTFRKVVGPAAMPPPPPNGTPSTTTEASNKDGAPIAADDAPAPPPPPPRPLSPSEYDAGGLPHAKLLIALPHVVWTACARRLNHDADTLSKQVSAFDAELRSLQEQLVLCQLIEQHERQSIAVVDGEGGSLTAAAHTTPSKNNVVVTRLENTVALQHELVGEQAVDGAASGCVGVPVVSATLRAAPRSQRSDNGSSSSAAGGGENTNDGTSADGSRSRQAAPVGRGGHSSSQQGPEGQLRTLSLNFIERLRTAPTTDRSAFTALTTEIDRRVAQYLWQLHHLADARRGPSWHKDAAEATSVATDESSASTVLTLSNLQQLEDDLHEARAHVTRQNMELQECMDRQWLVFEGFVAASDHMDLAASGQQDAAARPKDEPADHLTAVESAVWLQRQTQRHLTETEGKLGVALRERDEARSDLAECKEQLRERVEWHERDCQKYDEQIAALKEQLRQRDDTIRESEAANARLEILVAQRALESTEAKFEAQQLRESNRQLHAALRDQNTARESTRTTTPLARRPRSPAGGGATSPSSDTGAQRPREPAAEPSSPTTNTARSQSQRSEQQPASAAAPQSDARSSSQQQQPPLARTTSTSGPLERSTSATSTGRPRPLSEGDVARPAAGNQRTSSEPVASSGGDGGAAAAGPPTKRTPSNERDSPSSAAALSPRRREELLKSWEPKDTA